MKTLRRRLGLAVAGILTLAFVSAPRNARANVYATDIQLRAGSQTNLFNSVTNSIAPSQPLIVSYRLNQPATLGCTVSFLNGNTAVVAIHGGTNMGLNTVLWGGTNQSGVPVAAGTYTVSVTASASDVSGGNPGIWTQISVDTNAGMPANYPMGIAVDKNTNSPYYGRVVCGCASTGPNAQTPAAAKQIGLFKSNADGSQADEGWFGYAGYTTNDAGATASGQMNNGATSQTAGGFNPLKIRIADDDRIYWVDNSDYGAIISCDMRAVSNQIVLNEGGSATYGSWDNSGAYGFATQGGVGFQEFDITSVNTTNAALWLCDNDAPNNWGIWEFHMTNMPARVAVSDPNDTMGNQVVETGYDLAVGASGGCTIDSNLDIFVGQDVNTEAAVYDAMEFTNWHGGVLPPENGGTTNVIGTTNSEVNWGYGCGVDSTCATDPSFEGVADTVVNSRINPTVVACPMATGVEGIRLLEAANGSVLTGTMGTNMIEYTNLDGGQAYTCAAWDNVGNLYAASTTRNLWRVWSPSGPSTNTTMAIAHVTVQTSFQITSITAKPSGSGCSTVTITFTGLNSSASAYTIYGAETVNGPYTAISPAATVTGSAGSFTATFTSCSTQFYTIAE